MRDLAWRAQLIEEEIGRALVRQRLRRRFVRSSVKSDRVLQSIVRLPFGHILTTNYDNLLDLTHRKVCPTQKMRVVRLDVPGERGTFVNALGRQGGPRLYLHLHGRATAPNSCVLTEEDYRERYIRSHALARNLYALFASQTVVFIGFSLSDPDFVTILREVQALGAGNPRHFAILPRPEKGDAGLTAYLLGKYGVFPILYPNESGRHEGLAAMLEDLANLVNHPEKEKDWAFVDLEEELPDGRDRDPEDPNKGHFGGRPRRNGYELRLARVTNWDDGWSHLEIEVTRRGGALTEPVAFYLHPTFPESVIRAVPTSNRCVINFQAWGAFTVGAVVGKSGVRLELDLSRDRRLPKEFRAR